MNKKFKTKNKLIYDLLKIILIALFLVFVLWPIYKLVHTSFIKKDIFTFENYIDVIKKYKISLWHSAYIGFFVAIFTTLFSFCISIVINSSNKFVKNFILILVLISIVSPPFVASLSYIILYGRRGLITYELLKLSISPYNKYGIIIMQVISFIPLSVLFFQGNIRKIDISSLLSCEDLGGKEKEKLLDIIIPTMKRSILMIMFLTFVRSVCDFATPTIVGGRYTTLASDIYVQFIGYSDINKTAVMNVILMIPTFLIYYMYIKFSKNNDVLVNNDIGNHRLINLKKINIYNIIILFLTCIFVIFIFLQYAVIFIYGFIKWQYGKYTLTFDYIIKFLSYDLMALVRSILYAIIVVLSSLIIIICVSFFFNRKKDRIKNIIDILINLPYMIPGTFFGISYILAFNHRPLKLTGTWLIVVLNILFKQLAVSYKIIEATMIKVPIDFDKSAYDLGAKDFHVIKDVIIPNIKDSIKYATIYNFNSAMTTAGSIIFLIQPGKQLMVFTLFERIYNGEYHEASLISTIIILIVVIFSILILNIGKERNTKNKIFYI